MAAVSLKSLPVGVRFSPKDHELINHYLSGKMNGRESEVNAIKEVDVYEVEPWQLPDRAEKSVIREEDLEWFFFARLDRKYRRGIRSNRATKEGYWKATGRDRLIEQGKKLIGTKKTLVFYKGSAPGERTPWKMHEYQTNGGQGSYVICRVFRESDEMNASAHCTKVDQIDLFPTTTNSFPIESQPAGDAVVVGQFDSSLLNQGILESNVQENPQSLFESTRNELGDIEKMLCDVSNGVTFDPSMLEETMVDSLQECLQRIIDSPKETLDEEALMQRHWMHNELIGSSHTGFSCYNDYHEKYIGLPPHGTIEQDVAPDPYEKEFMDSVLNSNGEYSSNNVFQSVERNRRLTAVDPLWKGESLLDMDSGVRIRAYRPQNQAISRNVVSSEMDFIGSITTVDPLCKDESLLDKDSGEKIKARRPKNQEISRNVVSKCRAMRSFHLIHRESFASEREKSRGDAKDSQKIEAGSYNDIPRYVYGHGRGDRKLGCNVAFPISRTKGISSRDVKDHEKSREVNCIPRHRYRKPRRNLLIPVINLACPVSRTKGKSSRDAKEHKKIKEERDVEHTTTTGNGVSDLVDALKSWKPLQSRESKVSHASVGRVRGIRKGTNP